VELLAGNTLKRTFLVISGIHNQRVHGELIGSCGDWSLVQPATVPPPRVRIEIYRCWRAVNTCFRQQPFQPAMCSMAVIRPL
jgi:hypothetical protein